MLLASPPAKGLFHSAVIRERSRHPGERASDLRLKPPKRLLAALGLKAKRVCRNCRRLSTDTDPGRRIMPRTADAGKAGRIRWRDWEAALSARSSIPRSFRRTHSILTATRISEDVPVMVGWNKTESTVFMLSDKDAFSLDEAGMRKRLEGMVGAGSRCALIKMYRSENPKHVAVRGLFQYSELFHDGIRIRDDCRTQSCCSGRAPAYLYRFDWETPDHGREAHFSPHGLEMPMCFRQRRKRRRSA